MNNFDEYLKLRSTVEPPVDTDDTVMFDIVNRTIMPNHITDIIVKDDNLSRNIKYRIQRYFEGVDLSVKSISFRYNTPNSETDESFAKNVIIEEHLITFEWQVSNKVTYKSGIVEYDIMFYDNGGYSWHTKPATIKVEAGLEYHTLTPKPSYDWLDSWRAEAGNILVQCREAESKAIQVEGNISVAIDAVNRAANAVAQVESDLDKTLTKDNIVPYTPTEDYHPATKKFVEEYAVSIGTGDMLRSVYDTDNNGIVDNAKMLNGKTSDAFEPAFQKKTAFNKAFGFEKGSVCEGNDPRLSDTRIASGGLADSVPWDGVSNTPTTIAGYNISDAATKSYTDAIIANEITARENADKLLFPKTGGKISGSIEVSKITGLDTPTVNTDASNKAYVDHQANKKLDLENGGVVLGTVTVPKITGLNAPINDTDATNKAYVDIKVGGGSKDIYDKVIRTQAEFDALIASPTWLDAVSVCFVGNGGTLKFARNDGVNCKIPATVKQIIGIDNPIIEINNLPYSIYPHTNMAAFWYVDKPTTNDYSINNITINCSTVKSGSGNIDAIGFYNCINLTNCVSNCVGTNVQAVSCGGEGFFSCENLSNCQSNCSSIGYGRGSGFIACRKLTNCIGNGSGQSNGHGEGFQNCYQLTNCIGVGKSGKENYGFYSCYQLTNCNGTSPDHGFYNCHQLTNCIGNGINTKYSFSDCTYMNGCKTSLPTEIFKNCTFVDPYTNEGQVVPETPKSFTITLISSSWASGVYPVITVPWEVDLAIANGIIGLPITASKEQNTSCAEAEFTFTVSGKTLTIKANGKVPSIDIPITITIVG